MTNFNKLVRWDADFYNSLPDDDCIICVTEQEVYLLGQILDMLRWSKTRWIGNLVGMDFDLIASNLEYKLAERMSCTSITTLVEKISQLEQKIEYIFDETVINEGDTIITENTTVTEAISPETFGEDFTFATDSCDTADKDALYGGIREFVNYVNANNIDALQQVAQAGGVPEQAGRLISAMPLIGLLPFDEIADFAAFLANELLEEYEATVDETLLETVTCDLFCIAVANDCTFRLDDAINYFGGKLPTGFLGTTSSLANVVGFAATGTFAGDDYFYYMCVFQFIAVAVGDHYFSVHGMDYYMLRLASGLNSPDNDWTLLCDECPPYYRRVTLNFLTDDGGVYQDSAAVGIAGLWGVHVPGSGWELEDTGSGFTAKIALALDPTWEVLSVGWHLSGNISSRAGTLRPTAGSVTGASNIGFDASCAEYNNPSVPQTGSDGWNEIAVRFNASGTLYIEKMAIVYTVNHAPSNSTMTTDGDVCP